MKYKELFETVLQPLAITPIINEATALGISENQIEDFLVPVNEQGHPLYNPDLDYSVYLSNPFFLYSISSYHSVSNRIYNRKRD